MDHSPLYDSLYATFEHPTPPMIDEQLTGVQFREWSRSRNLLDMQFMEYERPPLLKEYPSGFENWVPPPPKKLRFSKNAKRSWTIFNTAKFGIAVHTNGTVVARDFEFAINTIRIEPTGVIKLHGGKPSPRVLASPFFQMQTDHIADELRAWVDRGEGRQMPAGIKPMLKHLKEVRAWRRKVCGRSKSCKMLFNAGMFDAQFPGYGTKKEQERSKQRIADWLLVKYSELPLRLATRQTDELPADLKAGFVAAKLIAGIKGCCATGTPPHTPRKCQSRCPLTDRRS